MPYAIHATRTLYALFGHIRSGDELGMINNVFNFCGMKESTHDRLYP